MKMISEQDLTEDARYEHPEYGPVTLLEIWPDNGSVLVWVEETDDDEQFIRTIDKKSFQHDSEPLPVTINAPVTETDLNNLIPE